MPHPFVELRPEYERLLATMVVERTSAVSAAADKIIRNFQRYGDASVATAVPSSFIGTLDLRESDCDPRAGLGQGDPWSQVSRNVPRGKGPWRSWTEAAIFYIHYDHLDDTTQPWSMAYACWKGEAWNGFGPRNHGIFTGYLWGGSNHYRCGKYVSDGVWDGNHVDTQLGIIPVICEITRRYPSIAIGSAILPSTDAPPLVPQQLPGALGELTGVSWIQSALNTWMAHTFAAADYDVLAVDGNYGRRTRETVRAFQAGAGLEADGLAGDATCAAIDTMLATFQQPNKPKVIS